MDGSSSSSSSMIVMPMIFQWAIETPLFSASLTPHSSGAYFGTFVFLIVLGGLYRGLHAIKHRKEKVWRFEESQRRIVVGGKTISNGKANGGEVTVDDKDGSDADSKDGKEKDEGKRIKVAVAPWRWKVDAIRAVLQFFIAGVGYLLMLSVMTLNVGYFFAVLIGIFIGELAFGRYTV